MPALTLVSSQEGPKFCPEAAGPRGSWGEDGHTVEPKFSGDAKAGTEGSPEG